MLQANNTGHDGSMTTIHANSANDALNRLEVLVRESGARRFDEQPRRQPDVHRSVFHDDPFGHLCYFVNDRLHDHRNCAVCCRSIGIRNCGHVWEMT